jgi:hypothetical protein
MLDLVEVAETTIFITRQESRASQSCAEEGIQHLLDEIQNHTSI